MASSLVRLVEALGECAIEVTAGSIRVAGDVVTDMASACAEPCDRLIRYDSEDREGRRREYWSIGETVDKAVSSISEVAEKSQKAFSERMEADKESPRTTTTKAKS